MLDSGRALPRQRRGPCQEVSFLQAMASSSRSTQDRPLKNTPSISSSPSRRRVGKQPTTSTPLPGLFSPIIINPRTGGNLQFPTISSSHHVGLNHAPRGPGLPPPTIKSSKHAPAPSLATTKPGTHSSSTPVLPSTLNSTSVGTGEGKKAKVTLSVSISPCVEI